MKNLFLLFQVYKKEPSDEFCQYLRFTNTHQGYTKKDEQSL